MLVGMLTRRVIVDEIDANFVADALAPEILVEVVVGHGKLRKKWPRGAANVPEQWTLPRSECRGLTSCPLRVLARPRQSFAIARRGNSCGYSPA